MSAISYTDDLVFSVNMAESSAQVCEAVGAMTDHRLLEATRTGDEAAFAELVRRYRNQITNYVYRMTNDYDLAVDLAQETFMRVYRAADRYQTGYAFSKIGRASCREREYTEEVAVLVDCRAR